MLLYSSIHPDEIDLYLSIENDPGSRYDILTKSKGTTKIQHVLFLFLFLGMWETVL